MKILIAIIILLILVIITFVCLRNNKIKKEAMFAIAYIIKHTYEQYLRDVNGIEISKEANNVKLLISALHKIEKNKTEKAIYEKLKNYYTRNVYAKRIK